MERFQAQYGWAVKHPEAIKRLCNIKASDLTATLAENLVKEILNQLRRMPKGAANYVVYGNATVLAAIDTWHRGK
nr:hypothetical protein [Treponema endosymbiont of Eucomonympha sp.]